MTTAARYRAFDVAVGQLFRKARAEGHSIPCTRGCDACCYDAALVTHVEMAPLLEAVRAMSIEQRAIVKGRIVRWFARMRAGGIDPLECDPDIRAFHRVHEPCPLLDLEHHECTVYDARPIACRGHHIVDAAPAACANRAHEPSVPMVLMGEVVTWALTALFADAAATSGAEEIAITSGLLPAMLATAWPLVEDPALPISEWIARGNADGMPLEEIRT